MLSSGFFGGIFIADSDCKPVYARPYTEFITHVTHRTHDSGNWKSNGSTSMVGELCGSLKNNVGAACLAEVVIAPPAVYLQTAQSVLADSPVALAAQNCSAYGDGAYTGEISAGMLQEMHIPYVILGHSERRALFKETPEEVGTKVAKAINSGLKVIACIGETLEQRESGDMYSVLEQQLAPIMDAVGNEASAWSNVVVAYEPVWYVTMPAIRGTSSFVSLFATLTGALLLSCVQGHRDRRRCLPAAGARRPHLRQKVVLDQDLGASRRKPPDHLRWKRQWEQLQRAQKHGGRRRLPGRRRLDQGERILAHHRVVAGLTAGMDSYNERMPPVGDH